jgi:biopolymer transport protein ExbD
MAMGPILGSGRRGRRQPMAEINVTPMVDVMLVLGELNRAGLNNVALVSTGADGGTVSSGSE